MVYQKYGAAALAPAAMQGMKESYSRFREHLFGHLKMASGSPSASPSGNGRRPAAWQLLLLLLLGAAIFLAHMVRAPIPAITQVNLCESSWFHQEERQDGIFPGDMGQLGLP